MCIQVHKDAHIDTYTHVHTHIYIGTQALTHLHLEHTIHVHGVVLVSQQQQAHDNTPSPTPVVRCRERREYVVGAVLKRVGVVIRAGVVEECAYMPPMGWVDRCCDGGGCECQGMLSEIYTC